jgi:small multidrug resistance pump
MFLRGCRDCAAYGHRLTLIFGETMSYMSNWLFLLGAIIAEVAGTTSMKLSSGFSSLVPSVLMFVFYAASLGSLTLAIRTIEVSVAYAIWSGLGTALIAVSGYIFFKESVDAMKVASISLIIIGVVGLNLSTRHV